MVSASHHCETVKQYYSIICIPFSDGVFLPCDHGLDLFTSAYVIFQSIKYYSVLNTNNSLDNTVHPQILKLTILIAGGQAGYLIR